MSSILAYQERPCIWAQMRGGGCGVSLSQWIQLCTWNNYGDLTPYRYLTYTRGQFLQCMVTTSLKTVASENWFNVWFHGDLAPYRYLTYTSASFFSVSFPLYSKLLPVGIQFHVWFDGDLTPYRYLTCTRVSFFSASLPLYCQWESIPGLICCRVTDLRLLDGGHGGHSAQRGRAGAGAPTRGWPGRGRGSIRGRSGDPQVLYPVLRIPDPNFCHPGSA